MKEANKQLNRLINDIEGHINDFEAGISDKDETVKGLVYYVIDCIEKAIGNNKAPGNDPVSVAPDHSYPRK